MMQLRDAVFKLAFLVLFLCTQGSRSFVIPRHHRPDAPPIFVTREEYFRPHFQVASEVPVDMGRMIQCAESDACSVSEMEEMVHGLQRLNESCSHSEGRTSMDCSLEAGEARLALKKALESKVGLFQAREEMRESRDLIQRWRTERQHRFGKLIEQQSRDLDEHSFDHYSDLREIAEYESH